MKITQARARGLEHAYVADIQDLPDLPIGADIKFDAMFTNAALHWCKRDPRGVLRSAKRVLKPGGRIAGEMGGFMNCIGELRDSVTWSGLTLQQVSEGRCTRL